MVENCVSNTFLRLLFGLLLLLLARYQKTQPISKKQDSKPIEFIVIPPEEPKEAAKKEPTPESQQPTSPVNQPAAI